MLTLAGNNTPPSNSSFTDRVFSTFRRKKYGSDPSEIDITVVIPALTQEVKTYTRDERDFHTGKNNIKRWKNKIFNATNVHVYMLRQLNSLLGTK